jgi:hypothetical protein
MEYWKETAWNGIRFMAPADWVPAEIGNRYLMLEDEDGPVMEVKWKPIKGAFSFQKHLHRLSTLHRGQPVEESRLPARWQKALEGFETSGFSWSGETVSARGAVLFCPKCRNATFVQFYMKAAEKADDPPGELLASFQDHPKNGAVIWSIFDIRAVVPEEFRLVHHRFSPGEYTISLSAGRRHLTLHRWGPAAVLLSEKDLEQFAREVAGIPDTVPIFRAAKDKYMLEWEAGQPSVPGWSRWYHRIRRKPIIFNFRIWQETEKNRILAIRMESQEAADPNILEKLAVNYEST